MDRNFKINESFIPGKKVFELLNKEMKLNIINSIPLPLNYTTYPNRTILPLRYTSELRDYLFEPIQDTNLIYLYLINFMSTNFCFYIQNGNVYSVKHRFTNHLFKGTLFECQYSSKESSKSHNSSINQPCMYIVNLLIQNGQIVNMNLYDNLKALNEIIDYNYHPDVILDPIKLLIKPIVNMYYLRSLILIHQPNAILCRHRNGKQLMILPGPFNTIQKQQDVVFEYQKFNPKYLVYFRLKYTDKSDIYKLYSLNRNNEEVFYDYADVATIRTSRFIRSIPDNSIILCRYNPSFGRWCPIKSTKNRTKPDIIEYQSFKHKTVNHSTI